MHKPLLLSITTLILFLAYTIYSQDLKIQDVRVYDKKVLIYTKEKCQFCLKAKNFLDKKGISYSEIDITSDQELHEKLKNETRQLTVPYIFINGDLIGGYKDLVALENTKIR